jgi:hypothetical protein
MHSGVSGTRSRGPSARSVRVISKIFIPLGQASSHRPQVAQNQGMGDAAISSIKSSSTYRIKRRMLNPLIPVMGQAELQRPHCSQYLNISIALNLAANCKFSPISIASQFGTFEFKYFEFVSSFEFRISNLRPQNSCHLNLF